MEKLLLRLEDRKAIYDSLKERAKKLKEKRVFGPTKKISDQSLPAYQEDDDDSSEEEFAYETSQFHPELSDEKKEKFFDMHGKVSLTMDDRRQIWLPREFCEELYEERLSYFSERSAMLQNIKIKLMNQFYTPHKGKYRVSGGILLDKYYEPQSLLTVSALAMTSDVSFIARGHGNGMVKIWNISTDSQVTMEPYEDSSRITKVKFIEKPDAVSLFAVSRAGNIYYLQQNPKGWGCDVYATEKDNEIESMDLSKRYKRLVTAGSDATIRVYNVETRKIEKAYKSYKDSAINQYLRSFKAKLLEDEGHYLRLYAVKFIDDSSSIFVSGGLDGTIKVWDVRVSAAVENLVGPLICGDTIDSFGNKLLCGQWTSEDSLLCYDIRTFKPISISPTNRILGSRGEYPYCCRFLRDYDGSFIHGIEGDLVMCGGCRSLELISLSEKVVVWSLPDEGNVVSVDNAFPFIAHASSAHHFTISTFSPSIRLYKSLIPYEESEDEEVKEEAVAKEEEEVYEGQVEVEEEEEEVELRTEEELSQKIIETDLEAFKSDEPLQVINDIIVKFATQEFPTHGDRFKAIWRLTRKRLLREWIESKDRYAVLKQQANIQKEVLHARKHRWCEKTVMLRKSKSGTETKTPVAVVKVTKSETNYSTAPSTATATTTE